MPNAVIYARYSSDNQKDESIDAQVRAIKEYCKKNNYEIIKIYIDEAFSATSDKRPGFLNLINDAKKNIFDAVIVHKLDRFARNRYDSAFYKKKLKDNRIKLISVLENLDDSPESIILESVLEGMAEYFSKNLSREVQKGLKENAKKAKHNGGPSPLGYDVDKNKSYIINEQESKIIETIFDLFVSGFGYTNIAYTLNQKGLKTKSNKEFSKISIRDILLNEKYTGTYVYNKRADGKTLNKLKSDEEIIRVADAHPAIINYDTFLAAQNKLNSNKRGPIMRKEIYILTGKITCGICGFSYTGSGYITGKNKNNKYYMYSCVSKKKNKTCTNKSIRKDVLENMVIEELKNKLLNKTTIEKIIIELEQALTEYNKHYDDEIHKTKNNVKKLESKISKTFDMYLDDNIDKALLGTKLDELKIESQSEKEKLIYLETKDYTWANAEKITKYLYDSINILESGDKIAQINVINAFVEKIIIREDVIDIEYSIRNPIDDPQDPDDFNNKGNKKSVRDKSSGAKPLLTLSLTLKR